MTMEFEIEIINPAEFPELAAQQIVIELIRAGKIDNSFNGVKAFNTYQHLMEKYKALAAESEPAEVNISADEPSTPAEQASAIPAKAPAAPVTAAKGKNSVANAPAAVKAKAPAKPKKTKPDLSIKKK